MANVRLGAKAVGSIVKIKVNGAAKDFIIVHQGKPSSVYDDSCNGTWLLMKDIYEKRQWNSSNTNDYANSTIHSYLNSTFLNLLEPNIKRAIKQVKLPYRKGSGSSETVTSGSNGLSAKIFLLSAAETSFSHAYMPSGEGTELAYFKGCADDSSDSKRVAYFGRFADFWWLRSPSCSGYSNYALYVGSDGGLDDYLSPSSYGIRPAFVLPSTLLVSDDGTVSTNTAPSTPWNISVPSSIMGGTNISISWAKSSDDESNLSGYKVERSTNGGWSWSQIYQGTATSTTDNIAFGTTSVMYRVKAYDTEGLESGYTTSAIRTVRYNVAPAINASSTSLGEKNAPFSFAYTVTDADGDTLTVTEKLDGKTTATRTGLASGTALTFEQASTADGFLRILNGSHTIKITANDGKESTSLNATFTKSVTSASVTLTTPLAVDGDITVAILQVSGSIPNDAAFKTEATNNALDDSPVWQDVTAEVRKGTNIVFENQTASAGAAFNFRISVEGGASGEGGYIDSVSGAFQ